MEKNAYTTGEKHGADGSPYYGSPERDGDVVVGESNELHKSLKGRHMQMIAM
jgi:amino acid permease